MKLFFITTLALIMNTSFAQQPIAKFTCEMTNSDMKKTIKTLDIDTVGKVFLITNVTKDESLEVQAFVEESSRLVIQYVRREPGRDGKIFYMRWTGAETVKAEIYKAVGGAGSELSEEIAAVLCTLVKS